jgi:gentisate 1,2-dioxygenase
MSHPSLAAAPPLPQRSPSSDAQLYDYRQAANPIRPGLTEPIPLRSWPAAIHSDGPTRCIPLDLSQVLAVSGPLTSPGLAASFIRIVAGDRFVAEAQATSSLFYVLQGSGRGLRQGPEPFSVHWQPGDLFVLPQGPPPELTASEDTVLYWVHDGPLLDYLGVAPRTSRFAATHYPGEWLRRELGALAAKPGSAGENRLSVLLANRALPSTRTVSHTLWAMYGQVPPGATQAPHRHQSVALDLIVDAAPGCYTLVGRELDGDGRIRDPQRIDWQTGAAFVTPPGLWHSHVNEGAEPAFLLPIQDAGLHTYLRTLDIRFR